MGIEGICLLDVEIHLCLDSCGSVSLEQATAGIVGFSIDVWQNCQSADTS